ncbi:autotransporter outer membrane beta-barrel domain-containing protein [Photobacterium sp. TY1-4]|uniref:autotransporter outer membrane beta-barrel domain-containing protein n=1 Tax=Photobacterium sp. TY1-4 TaxID=2899122 RepID=UPI0021BEDAEA|nr:autotransporter outer membrane beta-barrel domain-containing protein [Photobacterium sp. TY1-4]UXI04011.1 autotransporter outer membrane beta-barrel domain-containing protein [Photobacterium sp. TY1-4]
MLIVAQAPGFAAEQQEDDSLAGRLSDEMYQAISDLMLMANDFRGDNVSPKNFRQNPHSQTYVFSAPGRQETALRTSSLRAAAKDSARESRASGTAQPPYSELTVYQDGAYGEQNYTRLGAYFRVDNNPQVRDRAALSAESSREQEGYALTLGGDYLLNDHYLFGLALGLPFYDVNDSNRERGNAGLVASGYFSYFRDNWYLDFTASYALMDTDIERRISFYSDSVVNSANEADSDLWVFALGSGYVFNYDYLNVAFESSIEYTLSDSERYSERLSKGNANYLLSKIDNINELESMRFITGLSISHPFRSSLGIFQPYARGFLHYDVNDGSERIISQLKADQSGSVLPIIVETDDSVYGRVHLGLSGAFNKDWHAYAEASTLVGLDDMSAYAFSVGVSMSLD